jgi:acyl-CoA thioester hydrolase
MIDAPDMTPRREAMDLAGYEVPHPAPFLVDVRIGPGDLGEVIEHVSNVQYVSWLDRAAELHADSLGYTRRWMLDRGVMWFVARHEIDYCAEAWLGDELVVATWVRDMKRFKSRRDYLIIRRRDERVICRASTLWVYVDLATRRPRRVDGEMIRRFAPLERADAVTATRSLARDSSPCTSP